RPAPQVRRPLSPSEYPTNVQAGRPPAGPPPEDTTVVNARAAHTQHDVPPTEVTKLDNRAPDASNFATRFVKMLSPRVAPGAQAAGAGTIGAAPDNHIVGPDVLASRYHATLNLTPLGTEIRD